MKYLLLTLLAVMILSSISTVYAESAHLIFTITDGGAHIFMDNFEYDIMAEEDITYNHLPDGSFYHFLITTSISNNSIDRLVDELHADEHSMVTSIDQFFLVEYDNIEHHNLETIESVVKTMTHLKNCHIATLGDWHDTDNKYLNLGIIC